MKILKTLNVKTPARGTSVAAGLDFFVPENTEEFVQAFKEKNPNIQIDENGITMGPHERVNIPSGIKAQVPNGHALIAYNKSGVSLKYGLDVGATVVDEDYQGVIHLSLVNTSEDIVKINYGQKIIQFLLIPVFYDTVEEVTELFTEASERGEGGFGSTGTM
jgi:dUTP pyrophosphatase